MRLSIKQIQDITQGFLLTDAVDGSQQATHFTWDSRDVVKGSLYVALVGERVDGHTFIASAVDKGAVCVLVSRDIESALCEYASTHGCAVVQVASCEQAITDLAAAWRSIIPAKVIGITGSVGKTTTKALTREVLSQKYKTVATKGNFNNELGAPYTVLSADEDTEMLVVEMGMQARGEIAHICSFARPHIGLITNVGTSHIEFLQTQENIARAKGEIVEALQDGQGIAFLPAACEFNDLICEETQAVQRGIHVNTYGGTHDTATIYATDISLDAQGHPYFVLHAAGQSLACTLQLRGLHNVDNACGAAGIGLACGLTLEEVVAGLTQTQPESGRQEFKTTAQGAIVVNDAYNASPISMAASLAMITSYKASGKKIAILGDMGELGSESVAGHTQVGVCAAQAGLDLLVCVGPLSADMAQAACQAGMNAAQVVHVLSVENVMEALPPLADGDIVLVKASHYMGLDNIVEGLIGSC